MQYRIGFVFVAALFLLSAARGQKADHAKPELVEHLIATELTRGYQVVVADLNRDGKPDLIALASGLSELAWYENPEWRRHVLASGLSGLINVAAADLDGDGIPELALAQGFSTTPEKSLGSVSLLTHGVDPTQPWSVREIDRIPTSHRLRWFTPQGSSEKWLINAPLVGATAQPPEFRGATSLYFYRPPEWKRELLTDAEQGVVHAVEPVPWEGVSGSVLLSAGFLGIHRYQYSSGRWARTTVGDGDPSQWPKGGSSDVAAGRLGPDRFVAAIEPWHGNQMVIYRPQENLWQRSVVDATLTDAHTLLTVDLDGDGRDEVVVGQRRGSQCVVVYTANATGENWSRMELDPGGMAASSCATADLNLDGRRDLVCIGGATANLKWYENVGGK